MPRQLIDTDTDKRYVRRDEKGLFDRVVDVAKSLLSDRKTKAETTVKAGEGDRGDQKARPRTSTAARTRGKASAPKRATTKGRTTKARPRSKPKTTSRSRGR